MRRMALDEGDPTTMREALLAGGHLNMPERIERGLWPPHRPGELVREA